MKLLGYNIKDEYVWIGGGLVALWVLTAGGMQTIKHYLSGSARAYASQVCANGQCWSSEDGGSISVQCQNGQCTETEGDGGSMTQTNNDGSTMTSTDPQVAQDMIDQINRRIRRQQRQIQDEAEGNVAYSYQGMEGVGGGGMGGGAGGANGLGEINNDFMAQLQAMIQQAVADGMASGAGQDAVGESGANANGLPGLDANGAPGMGGHGGHGGIGGAGGAGGHGGMGMGGHARGGRGGMAMAGGGMGRKKKAGMGGAGAGGWKKKAGGGAGGAGKKKGMGGAGKAQGAAKGATPPDCTDPANAALPDCATPSPTDTGGTDSGFAYAYAGTPGGIGLPGQAGGIGTTGTGGIPNYGLGGRGRRPFRSYQAEDMGYPEEGYGDDEDDYFRAYNTGNTFDLNMPTNPMSSAAYGNTRYDQMTPWKVVTA